MSVSKWKLDSVIRLNPDKSNFRISKDVPVHIIPRIISILIVISLIAVTISVNTIKGETSRKENIILPAGETKLIPIYNVKEGDVLNYSINVVSNGYLDILLMNEENYTKYLDPLKPKWVSYSTGSQEAVTKKSFNVEFYIQKPEIDAPIETHVLSPTIKWKQVEEKTLYLILKNPTGDSIEFYYSENFQLDFPQYHVKLYEGMDNDGRKLLDETYGKNSTQLPELKYNNEYYVEIIIENNGRTSEKNGTTFKVINRPPTPSISFYGTKDEKFYVGIPFIISGTDTKDVDGDDFHLAWSLSDGNKMNTKYEISYEWTIWKLGTYSIELEATDSIGASKTLTKSIRIFEISIKSYDVTKIETGKEWSFSNTFEEEVVHNWPLLPKWHTIPLPGEDLSFRLYLKFDLKIVHNGSYSISINVNGKSDYRSISIDLASSEETYEYHMRITIILELYKEGEPTTIHEIPFPTTNKICEDMDSIYDNELLGTMIVGDKEAFPPIYLWTKYCPIGEIQSFSRMAGEQKSIFVDNLELERFHLWPYIKLVIPFVPYGDALIKLLDFIADFGGLEIFIDLVFSLDIRSFIYDIPGFFITTSGNIDGRVGIGNVELSFGNPSIVKVDKLNGVEIITGYPYNRISIHQSLDGQLDLEYGYIVKNWLLSTWISDWKKPYTILNKPIANNDIGSTIIGSDKKSFQIVGEDFDKDGKLDSTDLDDDNDGCLDNEDEFDKDPFECKDMDGDGMGDNSDDDKDGDGWSNEKDWYPEDRTAYLPLHTTYSSCGAIIGLGFIFIVILGVVIVARRKSKRRKEKEKLETQSNDMVTQSTMSQPYQWDTDVPSPHQLTSAFGPTVSKDCPRCGIPSKSRFCPSCGFEMNMGDYGDNQRRAPIPEDTKYCPKCGVPSKSQYCPACGMQKTPTGIILNEMNFCPRCGHESKSRYCPTCGYQKFYV